MADSADLFDVDECFCLFYDVYKCGENGGRALADFVRFNVVIFSSDEELGDESVHVGFDSDFCVTSFTSVSRICAFNCFSNSVATCSTVVHSPVLLCKNAAIGVTMHLWSFVFHR